MSVKEEWEKDIDKAEQKWKATHKPADYQFYAMACAAFLSSEDFKQLNMHWFCGDPRIARYATSSLIMFSFRPSEDANSSAHKRFELYDASLTRMLSSCMCCARDYQKSHGTLELELLEKACIPRQRVDEFLKLLHRHDRKRLTGVLKHNPGNKAAVTEGLWNLNCILSATFMQEVLFNELKTFPQVELLLCAPGFIWLTFNGNPAIRSMAIQKIVSSVETFKDEWRRSQSLFSSALNNGLRRNIMAANNADFAWYNAYVLLKIFSEDKNILEWISYVAIAALEVASGVPGYGAHALIRQILVSHNGHDGPHQSKYGTDETHESSETSSKSLEMAKIEKAIDYACSARLQYRKTNPDAPQASKNSQYEQLSAALVTRWTKEYVLRRPSGDALAKRIGYLASLDESAFESRSEFDEAARCVMKTVAHRPRDCWQVMIDFSTRLALSYSAIDADTIAKIWSYQTMHSNEWSSFWSIVTDSRSFARAITLEDRECQVFISGILQGSKKIGTIFQLPKKQDRKLDQDGESTSPSMSQPEALLITLIESLMDLGSTETLKFTLQTSNAMHSLLLMVASGNQKLRLAAIEFLKFCTHSDTDEQAIDRAIEERPEFMLEAINAIIMDASPATVDWLSALPGVIKLSTTMLDKIYSTTDGLETTSNNVLLKLLHRFWERSWTLVSNVLLNIRPWARAYATTHVKSVLTETLDFSQRLLSKYRLIDADLSAGTGEDSSKSWGAELAQPVIASITNMGDLLQLALPELLSMALSIIIEILGLMKSFKVEVPETLKSLFENLATRKLNSKLSVEQLRELLQATDLDDFEIQQVIDRKSSVLARRPAAGGKAQAVINDFFKQNTRGYVPLPKTFITSNEVVPSAPRQSSQIGIIKSQLLGKNRLKTDSPEIVVHPERPPGFNPRKPIKRTTADAPDDSSDDSSDTEESALKSLGAKQKGMEEAANRLKEAYEQSRLAKASEIVINGSSMRRTDIEDKERAKRLMKARLSVLPTELHQQILSWDYFSEAPPFAVNQSVPDMFDSVEHYQQVMAPLLYLEAWENIQQAKEELSKSSGMPPFPLIFGKRVKVDQFTDVYVSMPKQQFTDAKLAECDILLLSYDKTRPKAIISPQKEIRHCFARIKEGTIRHAHGSASKIQYVDFQVRLFQQQNFANVVVSGSEVSALSLGSLRTVEREFTALAALKYYDLQDQILKAQPAVGVANEREIQRYERVLGLNRSQASAVARAIGAQGFSLIQGPPGTGKTKTILGIIGAYFTSELSASVGGDHKENVGKKKILVCAPSNAAVDEIAVRLKAGVTDSTGTHRNLNLLRIGRMDRISEQVRDLTLEAKVSKTVANAAEPIDNQLRKDHTALVTERNSIRSRLQDSNDSLDSDEVMKLEDKLRDLSTKIREKNYALDMQRNRLEQASKQRDLAFRQEQNNVLQNAQVVLATLSASAHPLLASIGIAFETVIIDEAAQCIELSALIPLRYGCKQCIMVGDPNQLPPTVISQTASRLKYEQSLFVRMYNLHKVDGAISILDTQFRMHPAISKFPSKEFYGSLLKDGIGLADKLARPWHSRFPGLGPYMFYEVQGRHERGGGHSLRNMAEANSAVDLVSLMRKNYGDDEIGSIGVISPYKEQVRVLRNMFIGSFGADVTSWIDFNSIDGFQGQEKDIIILSCVRASSDSNSKSSIGFLGDIRRLNVAITRAKTSLWILGDPRTLVANPVWRALIEDASERGCIVESIRGSFIDSIRNFEASPRKRPLPESLELPEIPRKLGARRKPSTSPLDPRSSDLKEDFGVRSTAEESRKEYKDSETSSISTTNLDVSAAVKKASCPPPLHPQPAGSVPRKLHKTSEKSVFIKRRDNRQRR